VPCVSPDHFQRNIFAGGVHKAGEPLGVLQPFAGTEILQNAQQGLLASILGQLGGPQSITQD
jgi:hypothetical protein